MLDIRHNNSCGCCAEISPDLMSVQEAIALSLQQVRPTAKTESISLDSALGRVVCRDVLAPCAMPYFDNSAMDGFAVRCADTEATCLPIAGTVSAGDPPVDLPDGTALRIFTGAPLPCGADAVVMVEQSIESQGQVRFKTPPLAGQNIRRRGGDQSENQLLIRAGDRIAPHHIGLLAANGMARVEVATRARVAVFSTGDELTNGPARPSDGVLPDSNRPMLIALAVRAGADVVDLGILPDDADALTEAFLRQKGRVDMVLTSGAVSMGGKDHIRAALISAGGFIDAWRVALKPGKPVMFGRLGDSVVTGLPGNPFAAFVGFHLFAGPQIARLSGARPEPFAKISGRAAFEWQRKPGRAEVFPVKLVEYGADGAAVLERLGHGVSATLAPLADADGLAFVPADTRRVSQGDKLKWHPFCQNGDSR